MDFHWLLGSLILRFFLSQCVLFGVLDSCIRVVICVGVRLEAFINFLSWHI